VVCEVIKYINKKKYSFSFFFPSRPFIAFSTAKKIVQESHSSVDPLNERNFKAKSKKTKKLRKKDIYEEHKEKKTA